LSFPNLLNRISYSTIIRSSDIFFYRYYNMHKSALTFGVLASSLVMLMIMPFLNQSNNLLLNPVIAQEYNDKHGDNYYSTYQNNDKKYVYKKIIIVYNIFYLYYYI
jgi:hypothetical protein